jgi:hypothetical protein
VEAALKVAAHIATLSPMAVAGTKQNLNYARDHTVAEGLEYVANWNSFGLQSTDVMVAVKVRPRTYLPSPLRGVSPSYWTCIRRSPLGGTDEERARQVREHVWQPTRHSQVQAVSGPDAALCLMPGHGCKQQATVRRQGPEPQGPERPGRPNRSPESPVWNLRSAAAARGAVCVVAGPGV